MNTNAFITKAETMNTKLLMTITAIILGVLGIVLTFLPKEILTFFSDGVPVPRIAVMALQIVGALYFAMAMINWTAKANLIGGIYGRPIAIGNLIHFTMGALVMMRGLSEYSHWILAVTIVYTVLAAAFYIVFVTHPGKA